MWNGGTQNESKKLEEAVSSALNEASKSQFISVSMPAISGGLYGFPKEECVNIIVESTIKFLVNQNSSIKLVRFCDLDLDILKLFAFYFSQMKHVDFKPTAKSNIQSHIDVAYQWYWKENSGEFVPFDPDQNYLIEVAYIKQNGKGKTLVTGDVNKVKNNFTYEIDFDKNTEVNTKYKSNYREIKVKIFSTSLLQKNKNNS